MSLTPDQAAKAAKFLDLSEDDQLPPIEPPYRGSLPAGPPTDPLIYRFHELVQVGDGVEIQRQPDPKGDRVGTKALLALRLGVRAVVGGHQVGE